MSQARHSEKSEDKSPFEAASARWQTVIRRYARNGFVKKEAYQYVYECSDATADTAGPRLFGNVRFRTALVDYLERHCMSKSEALARLARQADSKSEAIAQGALDKILKASGAYVNRHEVSGPEGGDLVINIVNSRRDSDDA